VTFFSFLPPPFFFFPLKVKRHTVEESRRGFFPFPSPSPFLPFLLCSIFGHSSVSDIATWAILRRRGFSRSSYVQNRSARCRGKSGGNALLFSSPFPPLFPFLIDASRVISRPRVWIKKINRLPSPPPPLSLSPPFFSLLSEFTKA